MTAAEDTLDVGYDELCGLLMAKDLKPLWKETRRLNTSQPMPATLPWLWRWSSILPLAQKSGELVTIDRGGDRRVLALTNPGLGGMPFTTSTLWGAIQYLGPHESAPAHRHSASAIRFVLDGGGVFTTVDGDACDMQRGDLIITPNWSWHDHTNTSEGSMAWFDGLDLPFVVALDAVFFEQYPDLMQPVVGHNLSEVLHPGGGLVRSATGRDDLFSPRFRYPWEATDAALTALACQSDAPMVTLDYTNPSNGRPVLPTLGCQMHRLRPDQRTPTERRVGSRVLVVFNGAGRTVIDGHAFDWEAGDVIAIPSWAALDHQASETSDIFAITDQPITTALGLYREAVEPSYQDIVGAFEPR